MIDVDYDQKVSIVKRKVDTATSMACGLVYDSETGEVDIDKLYGEEAANAIHSYALFERWHYHNNIFNKKATLAERVFYNIDTEESILDEDIRLFHILVAEKGQSVLDTHMNRTILK